MLDDNLRFDAGVRAFLFAGTGLLACLGWIGCVAPRVAPRRLTVVQKPTVPSGERLSADPSASAPAGPETGLRAAGGLGGAHAAPPTLLLRAADAALRSSLQAYGILGAAVVVVAADGTTWLQTYGEAAADAQDVFPMTTQTSFAVPNTWPIVVNKLQASSSSSSSSPSATSPSPSFSSSHLSTQRPPVLPRKRQAVTPMRARGHVLDYSRHSVTPVPPPSSVVWWSGDALAQAVQIFRQQWDHGPAPQTYAKAAGEWSVLDGNCPGFTARLAACRGRAIAYGLLLNVDQNVGTAAVNSQLEATLTAYAPVVLNPSKF